MWVARCSYIKKLLGLDPFLQKMGTRDSAYYGSGRFAAEHWILSHPSVRPCDLYANSSYLYGYKRIPSMEELTTNLKLAMTPRFSLYPTLKDFEGRRILKSYPSFAERLDEYKMLYGSEKPDPEWWGWQFFNASSKGNHSLPPRIFSFR
ncbi:unnamed protein product [Cylindrotheca closterium]|uniref:Uncharacterized protein n=1 Tax=Cylindrotheca closterium TaxID=2856 RepID=A0AAD2G3Z5_9STRA|nr:unnamed protein product [Cylindrotheca closterium]